MGDLGYLIQLAWNNPYTDPPNGIRVLAEIFRPFSDPDCRKAPEIFDELFVIGDGYSPHYMAVGGPIKKLDPETLANVRVKRVERRIKKKYPMFAEQFLEDELAKKPAYYQGITDAEIEAKRNAAEDELARRAAFYLEHVGEVLVYGCSHSLLDKDDHGKSIRHLCPNEAGSGS